MQARECNLVLSPHYSPNRLHAMEDTLHIYPVDSLPFINSQVHEMCWFVHSHLYSISSIEPRKPSLLEGTRTPAQFTL